MKTIGTNIFQERKTYVPASIEVFDVQLNDMLCQSSYQAQDTIFGDTGAAGTEFSGSDINYGGSF